MVSVVVPVYNGEKYIVRTVENIINADDILKEVILIDDGSTDSSKFLCLQLVEKYSNVYYYYKENEGGVFAARNMGIRKACGDYISFCDQDDIVCKQMYSKLLGKMMDNDCDLGICSTFRYAGEEKFILEQFDNAVFEKNEIVENLLEPLVFRGVDIPEIKDFSKQNRRQQSIWKCLIKKELIIKNDLQFIRYVNFEDDYLMYLELLLCARRICTLSDLLYGWNMNMQSETYRDNYIEALPQKQEQCKQYIINVLEKGKVDEEIIYRYKQLQFCKDCMLIIKNEYGKGNQRSIFRQIKYIRESICIPKNQEYFDIVRYINKKEYRWKITIGLLQYQMVMLAYLFYRCYDKMVLFATNKKWFLKILEKNK